MASPTLDMSLSELWKRVKDREAWFAAVYGVAESWTHLTEQITISENEYYISAICICLLNNVYLDVLPIFNWGFFWLLSCVCSENILGINPLTDMWFANIFFCFIG